MLDFSQGFENSVDQQHGRARVASVCDLAEAKLCRAFGPRRVLYADVSIGDRHSETLEDIDLPAATASEQGVCRNGSRGHAAATHYDSNRGLDIPSLSPKTRFSPLKHA